MTKTYLPNPFEALYKYQGDVPLSDKPEIQELNQYAIDLESQIAEDLNLKNLISEFAYNQLAFVRNGLLLAKIKFLKLYKDYGDGTFASFCRNHLRKQRWQINDTIKAARVTLELMYAGFDILPTNIAQAVTLAKLTGEQLVEKWRMIIDNIPLDKITANSIRTFLKPPEKKDNSLTTMIVPTEIHENMQQEATARGLSIVEFLEVILEFFISGENSHLLQPEINTLKYKQKQQNWQEDLAKIVEEQEKSLLLSEANQLI